MKYLIVCTLLFLFFSNSLYSQTKAELEEKRKKTLEEISYVDNLLKTTEKEKNESINAVKIIGKKLNLRESVINNMGQEISLLSDRIALNTLAIDMMETDLKALKNDYAKAVINSYKQKKGYPDIVYILSAKDFNQGYKRLKYLQQVTKFRRRESEIILELKTQIETSKIKLQNDFNRISELKTREVQQKDLLEKEQGKKQEMVKSLSNREKQLKNDLEEKKRIASKIAIEIAKLIDEEKKKSIKSEVTPEQKLIGDNFLENKGRLPWPVEKGIITSHFGIQQNPVLKYVTEKNIGIEITSSGKVAARSIFQGVVANIFTIRGANMTVIIRHGKYLSVYTNIVNVKVKKGDKVETKEEIGDVYSDPKDNYNCVLKFMICETDYQDPEVWLTKN
jgi:septal ring factor EnvC (AmiA/AmiB activator)